MLKSISVFEKIKGLLPPIPPHPPAHEISRTTLLQLSALISIAIIAHFFIAKTVIALFALSIFIVKTTSIWFDRKSPPGFITILLMVLGVGLVIFFYGGWNGQRAGISFIVLLVSLKFLESRLIRDYYVVCLLLYFLAASSFLFESSVINIVLVIFYTIAITALLFKISVPTKISFAWVAKESSFILLKAIPLAVFLFFFFPRISGDFGFIQSQDQSESQGLEDSLVAGEMASSAFDNSLAFRVEFEKGGIPSQSQLYWRSKVMPIERSFQWEIIDFAQRNFIDIDTKKKAASLIKGEYKYNILHEKSVDKFVPYLDFVSGTSFGRLLDDNSVFVSTPKASAFSYTGSSSLRPSLPESSQINEALLLSTESKPSARLLALLTQWRDQASNNRELIQIVYQYFSGNGFSYSLTPPGLVEENPIDGFMFDTRSGYCEHYASAFTIMMRWLGIPARIVTGYQGGKLNTAGNYLEVRYSDAHAWSEVWLDGQWQRVDPTAAISPERIELGMDALQELWDGNSFGGRDGLALSDILNPTGSARLWQQINDTWNNIGYQWNNWVVNYDVDKQKELLANIGLKHKDSLLSLVGIISFGIAGFMLFYFWQMIPKPVKLDEIQRTYQQFTKKFKKHDLTILASDTPSEFQIKASRIFPTHSDEIDSIIKHYQQLRYGRKSTVSNKLLEQFKQQVKQFKLPSKP